jgi:hypothetical protein
MIGVSVASTVMAFARDDRKTDMWKKKHASPHHHNTKTYIIEEDNVLESDDVVERASEIISILSFDGTRQTLKGL